MDFEIRLVRIAKNGVQADDGSNPRAYTQRATTRLKKGANCDGVGDPVHGGNAIFAIKKNAPQAALPCRIIAAQSFVYDFPVILQSSNGHCDSAVSAL
jgi:hypothetical protein